MLKSDKLLGLHLDLGGGGNVLVYWNVRLPQKSPVLQPPQEAHEAEGVSAGQGPGDVEAVPVWPGQALNTLGKVRSEDGQQAQAHLYTINEALRVEAPLLGVVHRDDDDLHSNGDNSSQRYPVNLIYAPGDNFYEILLLDDCQEVSHVLG